MMVMLADWLSLLRDAQVVCCEVVQSVQICDHLWRGTSVPHK